jgi:hypothetical protein
MHLWRMKPEDLILPRKPGLNPAEVLDCLNRSAASRDPCEIQDAITSAHQLGLKPEFVPVFLNLLEMPDHFRHEDIVSGLQKLRDPRAINALYRTALTRHSYLDYDEFFGLARKCTWALADIGTPDALAKLKLLATATNPTIAAYAKKRIERWKSELHRKRP